MRAGGWFASCESALTTTGAGFTPLSAALSFAIQIRTPSIVSPPTPRDLLLLPIAFGLVGLTSTEACACGGEGLESQDLLVSFPVYRSLRQSVLARRATRTTWSASASCHNLNRGTSLGVLKPALSTLNHLYLPNSLPPAPAV